MQQTPWSLLHIKQCEQQCGQAALSDERLPVFYAQDFGRLQTSPPSVVFVPETLEILQKLLRYANAHSLPVTIRGKGLSQGGQALAVAGGAIVDLQYFNEVSATGDQSIWVEANASWSDLLAVSLPQSLVPKVIPYNCGLSVGGVLSAGGVGASSFKYGTVNAHVDALQVITADGHQYEVAAESALFQACLGGQGHFGVISQACIALRPCQTKVRTFFLLYLDKEPWLQDMQRLRESADYMEFFCTPAVQGARLSDQGRLPFAQWFYALHVSMEYESQTPELPTVNSWKTLHVQDESIHSYLHRHDSRFQGMKRTGQWELQHPWYECFVTGQQLFPDLEQLLSSLPVYYATVLQIVPMASAPAGFMMLGEEQDNYAVMILNPGLPPALIPGCLDTMQRLDERFLSNGGKRYLSGFLGADIGEDYWQQHFGNNYSQWLQLKQDYDPNGIFCSLLHR